MGKSLNQVIREDLERLTNRQNRTNDLNELLRLNGQGNSQGRRFDRDELHERT